jgi:UV DNA damage endonuclease
VSSPAHGWRAKNPRIHADYVDVSDFPEVWKKLSETVDVEARAKELAVMKLMRDLSRAR